MLPHAVRLLILKRAGVRFFLGDAEHGKVLDQDFCLDLQLPREFVDADLPGFCHQLSVVLRLKRVCIGISLAVVLVSCLSLLLLGRDRSS